MTLKEKQEISRLTEKLKHKQACVLPLYNIHFLVYNLSVYTQGGTITSFFSCTNSIAPTYQLKHSIYSTRLKDEPLSVLQKKRTLYAICKQDDTVKPIGRIKNQFMQVNNLYKATDL